jgi:hypothetical protein
VAPIDEQATVGGGELGERCGAEVGARAAQRQRGARDVGAGHAIADYLQ